MDSKNLKTSGLIIIIAVILSLIITLFVVHMTNTRNSHIVKVDIVKINNQYMGKAVMLITGYNPNLTQDQKLMKAQAVMKIVGSSVENLLNVYSKEHNVTIVQSQSIASDANAPLQDITNEIIKNIDKNIDKDKLDAVAK